MATTLHSTDRPTTSSPSHRSGVFVTTQWSVVLQAGQIPSPTAEAALAELCRIYWPPLYAYARRMGHAPADAQDLTQGFFAELLARHLFEKADASRGRFRSFLLAAFKHYLAHQWEKSQTRKRGGHVQILPLEFDTAETRCGVTARADESPDRQYDRQWALTLLDSVLERLEKEYSQVGRADLFAGLKVTLTGNRADLPYRAIATQCGLSEGAVKVAAHRLRHRYRELLREEMARTVANPAEVEEELRHLFAALSNG